MGPPSLPILGGGSRYPAGRRAPTEEDVVRWTRREIGSSGNPTADIPTFVVVAVLFSAGLHASWNALVKTTDDAFLRFALIDATGLVSSLAAVAFVPIPFGCWRYLGASAIIHIGYKAFLMWSYRSGDISLVYPIARGSAPLLVAIGGAAFVHEPLGVFGILGVGLVSLGVASIALRKERRGHPPSGARRCTADGRDHRRLHDRGWPRRPLRSDGVRLRGVALPPRRVGVPAVGARDAEVLAALVVRSAGAHRRVAGLLACSAYGITLWAQTSAPLAFVAALRETSVLFAAAIGAVILHERAGKTRIVSAAIVVAGIVVLRLA